MERVTELLVQEGARALVGHNTLKSWKKNLKIHILLLTNNLKNDYNVKFESEIIYLSSFFERPVFFANTGCCSRLNIMEKIKFLHFKLAFLE